MRRSTQVTAHSSRSTWPTRWRRAAFLEGKIGFTDVPRLVEEALGNHPFVKEINDLDTIWEIHRWAAGYLEGRLRRINA